MKSLSAPTVWLRVQLRALRGWCGGRSLLAAVHGLATEEYRIRYRLRTRPCFSTPNFEDLWQVFDHLGLANFSGIISSSERCKWEFQQNIQTFAEEMLPIKSTGKWWWRNRFIYYIYASRNPLILYMKKAILRHHQHSVKMILIDINLFKFLSVRLPMSSTPVDWRTTTSTLVFMLHILITVL